MRIHSAFLDWVAGESPWSDWAKPAAFAGSNTHVPLPEIEDELLAQIHLLPRQAALLVDLPGPIAAILAPHLARAGWRPVPCFNGCAPPPGATATVPGTQLHQALVSAARELAAMRLPAESPPAFLVDDQRQRAATPVVPGVYDNRWLLQVPDLPSGNRLLAAGCREACLWSHTAANDVAHVCHGWQQAGLQLSRLRPATAAAEAWTVARPRDFGSLWHRIGLLLGLRRSAAGGFGERIPVPHQSSGRSGFS